MRLLARIRKRLRPLNLMSNIIEHSLNRRRPILELAKERLDEIRKRVRE